VQEVKQTIDQYEMLIQSLVTRSRDVPPLTMRSQRQIHAVPVVALCSYKHVNVSVDRLLSSLCYRPFHQCGHRLSYDDYLKTKRAKIVTTALCFVVHNSYAQ